MKRIYLIRHCKAEGQEQAAKLTTEGIEQSHQLAKFLENRNIDYIVTSPFERAVETIIPFCNKLGLDYSVDNRLEERVLSSQNLDN